MADLSLELKHTIAQKDQAYAERNKVVAAIAHMINSISWTMPTISIKVGVAQHPEEDKNWEMDWRTILVIESNIYQQMTWHFHDSEKYLLEGLPEFENYKWDGHTTEEKYERLLKFAGLEK